MRYLSKCLCILLLPALLVPDPAFDSIQQLYNEGDLNRSLEETRQYLKKNPHYLPARMLLFDIYLQKKQHLKAEKELHYISRARDSEETWEMAARFYFEKGDYKKCEDFCYKILANNKRSIPALLFKARIDDSRQYFDRSRINFREAAMVDPNNEDLLYHYSLFLIKHGLNNDLKEILSRYRRSHPESHRFFYINSLMDMNGGKYGEAETWIRKALYYKDKDPLYQNQLALVLYRQNKYDQLISELKKTDLANDPVNNYRIAYINYLKTKKDTWKSPNQEFNRYNLFSYLDKSLTLDEGNEIVRFFTEQIVINNYPFSDPLRRKYAAWHKERADHFRRIGHYTKAHPEFLRTLKLAPQEISFRRDYAEFLKEMEWSDSCLEEFKIIKRLSKDNDFRITTSIDLQERKQKQSIAAKHSLDYYSIEPVRQKLLLYHGDIIRESTTEGTVEAVYRMTADILGQLTKLQVIESSTGSLESVLDKTDSDYYALLKLSEYPASVSATLSIFDSKSRTIQAEKTFFTDGKNKFFELMTMLRVFADATIPPRGSILNIKTDKLVLSLGSRDGIKPGDQFHIYKGSWDPDKVITTCTITKCDERFSLSSLDSSEKQKFIRAGYFVLFKKPKKSE